jgi:hypothetical protein
MTKALLAVHVLAAIITEEQMTVAARRALCAV